MKQSRMLSSETNRSADRRGTGCSRQRATPQAGPGTRRGSGLVWGVCTCTARVTVRKKQTNKKTKKETPVVINSESVSKFTVLKWCIYKQMQNQYSPWQNNTEPSSVKCKLFYDTKEIVSTVNKVLEPSPSSFKEHINRKHRHKLQENHTKPKKWKPQPFRVSSARDRQTQEWWRVFEFCAVTKIPGTPLHLDTSCLNQLCSQPLTWPSNTWPTGDTTGSFLRNLHMKIVQPCRAHLATQARRDIHSFVFFLPTL